MKLIEFPEQTVVIGKDQPEYMPIPAHRFTDDLEGRIACCWKLTWKERLAVLLRGVLWHQVLTFNKPLQPQLLTVEKPEMKSGKDDCEHDWKEEYYGTRCSKCDTFYPFGCEPWMPT